MQVWDAHNKGYIFEDKYYGRDLRAGRDFQEALTRYITSTADGGKPHVLTHHIPTILSKITQLGKPPPFPPDLSWNFPPPLSGDLVFALTLCGVEAIVR